jgi:uncharacterized membrane protein
MSGSQSALAVSVFLACTVEAVEALTIVLAVGTTRSWRSALYGVGAGVLALAAVVAALGPAVGSIPIGALRVAVGGLLLVFGLQWLRKAVLRAAGLKALHDEQAIFAREAELARAGGGRGSASGPDSGPGSGSGSGSSSSSSSIDGYAFTIAFKGVLLEGLEVVFIVLTFGTNQHDVGLAAAAAGVAVIVVVAAGVAVRAPLARVPENTMKFVVGVLLSSFGTFWLAEGVGAHWPGQDASLLGLIAWIAGCAVALVAWLRSGSAAAGTRVSGPGGSASKPATDAPVDPDASVSATPLEQVR